MYTKAEEALSKCTFVEGMSDDLRGVSICRKLGGHKLPTTDDDGLGDSCLGEAQHQVWRSSKCGVS